MLEVEANVGEFLWGPWLNGFDRGMRLSAGAWEAIADTDDEETVAPVRDIVTGFIPTSEAICPPGSGKGSVGP